MFNFGGITVPAYGLAPLGASHLQAQWRWSSSKHLCGIQKIKKAAETEQAHIPAFIPGYTTIHGIIHGFRRWMIYGTITTSIPQLSNISKGHTISGQSMSMGRVYTGYTKADWLSTQCP